MRLVSGLLQQVAVGLVAPETVMIILELIDALGDLIIMNALIPVLSLLLVFIPFLILSNILFQVSQYVLEISRYIETNIKTSKELLMQLHLACLLLSHKSFPPLFLLSLNHLVPVVEIKSNVCFVFWRKLYELDLICLRYLVE